MKEANKKLISSIIIAVIAAVATISAAYMQLNSKEASTLDMKSQKSVSTESPTSPLHQETHGEKSPIINNANGSSIINY